MIDIALLLMELLVLVLVKETLGFEYAVLLALAEIAINIFYLRTEIKK